MVAFKDVANTPLIARSGAVVDQIAEYARKVPVRTWRMVILAVAIFWIVHSLAKAVWYVIPTPQSPVPKVVPTTATGKSSNQNERKIDIDAIIAMELLGAYNAEPVEAVEAPVIEQDDVEITKLNLQLQGIIAADDPKRSWAIIGPNDQNQKMYKIGDPVDGVRGVKIAEIFELKVRLNNNGKLEDLWLYGEDGMKVAKSGNYVPPAPTPRPAAADRRTVDADQIRQARNIGDVVRFMVATENGKMIGYKVRPGRKRELFDQVGLQPDDIVVSVNGIEVNEPQKVREVYQALKNATEANLQVMRDGATHSIQISMSSEG